MLCLCFRFWICLGSDWFELVVLFVLGVRRLWVLEEGFFAVVLAG